LIKINDDPALRRHLLLPAGARQNEKGVMIKFFPWDIWAAVALAITVGLAAIFDPAPAVFIVIYLGLCAYIVVETVNGEPR
jgi:hypothetical protein